MENSISLQQQQQQQQQPGGNRQKTHRFYVFHYKYRAGILSNQLLGKLLTQFTKKVRQTWLLLIPVRSSSLVMKLDQMSHNPSMNMANY